MEEEYTGRFRRGTVRIWDSGRIFSRYRYKERIQRRRWKIGKSSRIEEIRIGRKHNEGVCTGV